MFHKLLDLALAVSKWEDLDDKLSGKVPLSEGEYLTSIIEKWDDARDWMVRLARSDMVWLANLVATHPEIGENIKKSISV